MNVTLTLMALSAFGIGVLIAYRLKAATPGNGGRADWRGPGPGRIAGAA